MLLAVFLTSLIASGVFWLEKEDKGTLLKTRIGVYALMSGTYMLFFHLSERWLSAGVGVRGLLCLILFFLGVLFETDRTTKRLFEIPLFLLMLCGIALQLMLRNQTIGQVLLGMFIGGGLFGIQYLLFKRKSVGRGDILLGIALGVIFGFPNILFVILVSTVLGSIVSLGLLAAKRIKRTDPVPLGSFLALGSLITLLFAYPLSWLGF